MQPFLPTVAGIDDFLQVLDDLNDDVVVGQRAVSQVIDRAHLSEGVDDTLGQLRELLLSNVRQ